LFFFPRGGSAQVARALCRVLPRLGWEVSLAAGSLGSAGERGHAPSFFSGLELVSVDYSPAQRLADPTVALVPFQPSYEDRPGAPDRVFAAVDDAAYERLVAAWGEALARAGAAGADVLHLHHLTPVNEVCQQRDGPAARDADVVRAARVGDDGAHGLNGAVEGERPCRPAVAGQIGSNHPVAIGQSGDLRRPGHTR
jgi:hypothetical protein